MLWAITSLFNPVGYRRRLLNYRAFRSRLNVPLVTVELAYGQEFELHRDDADILIQVRCPDVLWQKERLLNIALEALPPEVQKFAWIDCDIVFTSDDWAHRAVALLEDFSLMHLYDKVHLLDRWATVDALDRATIVKTRRSGISAFKTGLLTPEALYSDVRPDLCDGYAWVARREVFATTGFYDACIVGGGDRAMLCAAIGQADYGVSKLHMSAAYANHFREWARIHLDTVQGNTGFLKETIYHLWHGDLMDRQYADRHKDLVAHQFDPERDIRIDTNGCWRWNSDKPEMHEYVKNYFRSRNEDGRPDSTTSPPGLS